MPKHKLTQEDCRKGGRARAALPDWKEVGLKGRDTTADRYGVACLFKIIKRGKPGK